jgi:hypothetical protein
MEVFNLSFVVKLYDENATTLHIRRCDDLESAEKSAKSGLRYSRVAIIYEGEAPIKLYDQGAYQDGFPLGVGSY